MELYGERSEGPHSREEPQEAKSDTGRLQIPPADGLEEAVLSQQNLKELKDRLRRTETLLRAEKPTVPEVEIINGKPYLPPGIDVRVLVLQDCSDAEARLREGVFGDRAFPKGTEVQWYPISPFSKEEIGFLVASRVGEAMEALQIGRNEDPTPTIIVANAEPRNGNNPNGKGGHFVFADLGNNHFYFGTLGHELSLVKDKIQRGEIFEVNLDIVPGTVYRSRFLREAAGRWLRGDESILGKKLSLDLIPERNLSTVGHVDSFGNIKTLFSDDSPELAGWKVGESKFVTINGVSRKVKRVAVLGDANEGDLIIAPGSTRHPRGRGDELVPLYDIYKIRGNAAKEFCRKNGGELGGPKAGDKITVG